MLSAISANRRRVVAPATTDMQMGFNIGRLYVNAGNVVENDHRFADNIYTKPSAVLLPAANYDSNGRPASLPGSDTQIEYVFIPPESAGAITVPFTKNNGTAVVGVNCTINSGDINSGSLVVTPDNVQPTNTAWVLRFTVSAGGIPPWIGSAATKNGVSASRMPSFDAHFTALCSQLKPLRTMKRQGCEGNEGVTNVTDTSNAFPATVLTATNRNTLLSCDWYPNTSTRINDGWPLEADIALAQAKAALLWRTLPWNADNTYYDKVGDLLATSALAGFSSGVEVSNEVWNGGYPVFRQARYQGMANGLPNIFGGTQAKFTGSISGTTLTVTAMTSGTIQINELLSGTGVAVDTKINSQLSGTTGGVGTYSINNSQTLSSRALVNAGGYQLERYIEKCIDVFDRIKARFTAAEVANSLPAGSLQTKLYRIFAWQNLNIEQVADKILDYAPPGKTALKDHIDVFATAPYIDQDVLASNLTNVTTYFEAAFDRIDTVIDTALGGLATHCATRVNDRGVPIKPGIYEWGQSFYIDDAPTRTAFQDGARQYDLNMHAMARTAAKIPGALFANFCLAHEDYSNQSFGMKRYTGKAAGADTPKYNAQAHFNSGKRKLVPLVGSLFAATGAPVGTILGNLKRRTPGSTITLQSNPGTAVTITDPTAQTLQFKVATAAAFTSAGTVNITVRESDPRDATGVGFLDTVVSIPVSGGTVWSGGLSSIKYSLSGGTTATAAASNPSLECVKASVSRTSGSYKVTVQLAGGTAVVGVCATSQDAVTNDWPGEIANSVSIQANGNILSAGGSLVGTASSGFTSGDVVEAVIVAGKFCVKKNGVDIFGSSSTGGGGYDVSTWGALRPCCAANNSGASFAADFTGWP
jgi:hypothetical protein